MIGRAAPSDEPLEPAHRHHVALRGLNFPDRPARRALATGGGAEVSLIMAKAGFEAGDEVARLAGAVRSAHRTVRGAEPPPRVETAVVSMWRDTNIINGHGIPSLTFGPSRGRADVQGEGFFALDDLVDAAKMYALTALEVAG